jgi:hypothetical protein
VIEMVVEGMIDNKIQNGHRFKGKQQNSFNIHTRVLFLVSNPRCFGGQGIHKND